MQNHAMPGIVDALLLCLPTLGQAEETSITLPTNDGTSSFTIKKNDGTEVFKVDGSGAMTGNGSGLSHVKPIVVFSNGDYDAPEHSVTVGAAFYEGRGFVFTEGYPPGLNLYEAQAIKTLTINCPGPGIIVAQATGYASWRSTDEDLARIWFHPHPDVPPDNWETPDYKNLRIVADFKNAATQDQYTSWSISKSYVIPSAQSFTVRICADKPYTSSAFILSDISMQLMFFPQ